MGGFIEGGRRCGKRPRRVHQSRFASRRNAHFIVVAPSPVTPETTIWLVRLGSGASSK